METPLKYNPVQSSSIHPFIMGEQGLFLFFKIILDLGNEPYRFFSNTALSGLIYFQEPILDFRVEWQFSADCILQLFQS